MYVYTYLYTDIKANTDGTNKVACHGCCAHVSAFTTVIGSSF